MLARHAKAEPFAATDHARNLTDRGRKDAAAAGTFLRDHAIVPDYAVVSTSARTRATWEAMEEVLGSGADVVYDGAVYAGSTDVVLETLHAVPEDASAVLFVGHQPTVGSLAHLVDDGTGDQEALHSMLHGFPAGSLAVFDVEVPWAELGPETGRLIAFRAGRD